jgi:hypothetical protein
MEELIKMLFTLEGHDALTPVKTSELLDVTVQEATLALAAVARTGWLKGRVSGGQVIYRAA